MVSAGTSSYSTYSTASVSSKSGPSQSLSCGSPAAVGGTTAKPGSASGSSPPASGLDQSSSGSSSKLRRWTRGRPATSRSAAKRCRSSSSFSPEAASGSWEAALVADCVPAESPRRTSLTWKMRPVSLPCPSARSVGLSNRRSSASAVLRRPASRVGPVAGGGGFARSSRRTESPGPVATISCAARSWSSSSSSSSGSQGESPAGPVSSLRLCERACTRRRCAAIASPSSAPRSAATALIASRAVPPSGGVAAGNNSASPIPTTRPSKFAGGTTKVPSPNKAANHSATIAGKAGCAVSGLVLRLALMGWRRSLSAPDRTQAARALFLSAWRHSRLW